MSDESMVERVARAFMGQYWPEGREPHPVPEGVLVATRRAIAAMREPTEAMLVAGDDWLTNADCRTEASAVLRAMIDSALSS